MEKTLDHVEVKIVSREAVKPSSPTPTHLKEFPLSYVDQIVSPGLSSGLLFYTATAQTQPLNTTWLKTCLSQTLTKFYPLAGRVKQSSINCNDEGIPFIEAHIDCPLSSVLHSALKLNLVSKFLPPQELFGLGGNGELVHLAIQINVFTCGGVGIGWYDIHKITDAISSVAFFKRWAALASGNDQGDNDLVDPDFNATIATFPSLPGAERVPVENATKGYVETSPTVVRSFLFRNSAINDLKARATSEQVPRPTRFQTVAGFIWEQALQASQAVATAETILHVTLNMRPWMNPPLPTGSIGNLAIVTVARALKQAALPDLVVAIQAAITAMKDEIGGFEGEKGMKGVRANWDMRINTLLDYKERAYKLISWCRLGFSDLDFGFGKPVWMVPTDGTMYPIHRNMIILNDYSDSEGDGIEAWLFLEEKEMDILMSNKDFLSFASPVYCN